MPTTFSVLQVAQHIEAKVRDAWDNQFWVRGEVSGFRERPRGGQYFDLVETDAGGKVLATLNVSVPPGKWRLVQRRLEAVGQPLATGLHIRIKAQLNFWVQAGRLSLTLSDIDPEHTAGAIALARRQLLESMEADGTRSAQQHLPVPRMPLRLGLITARDSQAHHDLVDELRRSRLPFRITLVASQVQGGRAPAQLVAAIGALGRAHDVDVVLLTRGGGAEVDLMTFDDPSVARAVAACPIPIWTGIGHHLDSPVAEVVAARGLKTPTALAQAVVQTVTDGRTRTEAHWTGIQRHSTARLRRAARALDVASGRTRSARVALHAAGTRLTRSQHQLAAAATRRVTEQRTELGHRAHLLDAGAGALLERARRRLDQVETAVGLSDPLRLLERGWSLTTDEAGDLVTEPRPAGTTLHTRTRGGTLTSTVIENPDD